MLRKLFLVSVALTFALGFAGCGEDDDDGGSGPGEGKPPAEMLGDWVYASVTVNGNPANLGVELDFVSGAVQARIFIGDIGTYFYQETDPSGDPLWWEGGFVFIDGPELDINILNDQNGSASGMTRVAWSIDVDTLTLTRNSGGAVTVFTLTRL